MKGAAAEESLSRQGLSGLRENIPLTVVNAESYLDFAFENKVTISEYISLRADSHHCLFFCLYN